MVFLGTCALECLQLWHPPFLESLRSHFIGQTILGTTFAGADFPYYFLGCWIGWGWIRYLKNLTTENTEEARRASEDMWHFEKNSL